MRKADLRSQGGFMVCSAAVAFPDFRNGKKEEMHAFSYSIGRRSRRARWSGSDDPDGGSRASLYPVLALARPAGRQWRNRKSLVGPVGTLASEPAVGLAALGLGLGAASLRLLCRPGPALLEGTMGRFALPMVVTGSFPEFELPLLCGRRGDRRAAPDREAASAAEPRKRWSRPLRAAFQSLPKCSRTAP